MTYRVDFQSRDFLSPVALRFDPEPTYLSWSAYGGPRIAHLQLSGTVSKLLEFTSNLRSPVTIYTEDFAPIWWGYVSEITIYLKNVQLRINLENLFNKVKVRYSFVSPDRKLAQGYTTAAATDTASQAEFGVREIILERVGIDTDYAEALRDTFLDLHSWPEFELSQSHLGEQVTAQVKCYGWYETLRWKTYSNLHGFFANYGPGPGTFEFNQSASYRYPSQLFTPGAAGSLKYAYFQLRKVGSPARNIYARLKTSAGVLLASSAAYNGALLDDESYTWVKFTFATPYALASGTTYMIGVDGSTPNAANYFAIKTDENMSFIGGRGQYYNGATWVNIPSITQPGRPPDLIFRAICLTDTGDQIDAIATSGDQFFSKIRSITTGILTCPYLDNDDTCLDEIEKLSDMGTSTLRPVLSSVNSLRQLEFYEQPDPKTPTVFFGDDCIFYTFEGIPLKPYYPPVGQYAIYSGSDRIMLPFANPSSPMAFIKQVEYWPTTGEIKIISS